MPEELQVIRPLHKMSERKSWETMKRRCFNPNYQNYKYYGGRGITVCEKWRNSFLAFYQDMGPKPTPKHTLDRIDVNKGYEPSNCRWATQLDQARNKRNITMLEIDGVKKCLTEWSDLFEIRPLTVHKRIKRGWPINNQLFKQ